MDGLQSSHRLATPMKFLVSNFAGVDIVWKCWQKKYTTMAEVSMDLREFAERQGFEIWGEDDILLDSSVSQVKGHDIFGETV